MPEGTRETLPLAAIADALLSGLYSNFGGT